MRGSDPARQVELPGEAPVVVEVQGAQNLPDAQHVALGDLAEGPGVLVVLLLLLLRCVHGGQTLPAHHLKYTAGLLHPKDTTPLLHLKHSTPFTTAPIYYTTPPLYYTRNTPLFYYT